MGCASSKQKRCRHCQGPYSPVPRSHSMYVHHPAQRKGDSYHVVALTSSTLGSLKLDSINQSNNEIDSNNSNKILPNGLDSNNGNKYIPNGYDENKNRTNNHSNVHDREEEEEGEEKKSKGDVHEKGEKRKQREEFSVGLIEAKAWSNMMEEKIPKVVPKTPIRTPPGEPETINTWELMEGLEDNSTIISPLRSPNHLHSFSFDFGRSAPCVPFDRPQSRFHENAAVSPKPIWLQMADNDPNSNPQIPEFDPGVISTFRRSLQEQSPNDSFQIQPSDNEKKVNAVVSDFKFPSFSKETVVVYFTSLRGVRKTYEDCCHVKVILKSIGVRVDERDVSMHSGFKDELRELMGDGFNAGGLPRVFVGKKYIGGSEEIRRMNEEGQLEKLLEGCEMVDDGFDGGNGGACDACGDIRFVPCETCSGSCKVYYECEEEEEAEETEEGEYGFQRCPDCNENGLIRCPICCY